jgi:hypothetical protein
MYTIHFKIKGAYAPMCQNITPIFDKLLNEVVLRAAFWLPGPATPEICTTEHTIRICAKSTCMSHTCL